MLEREMGAISRSAPCVGLALAVLAIAAPASAITQNACLGRKLGDVGGTVGAALACLARDAAKPDTVKLSHCLDKLDLRFSGGDDPTKGLFAKRERKLRCPTVGNQDAIGLQLFTFVDTLDHAVGNLVSRCDGAKLSCFGKYAAAAFGCLSRAATGPGVIDSVCLTRAGAKLGDETAGCLEKAARRADCSPGAAAATLAADTEGFIAATLCELDASGTSECRALPMPVSTPKRGPSR
jgi:hypothetical protein